MNYVTNEPLHVSLLHDSDDDDDDDDGYALPMITARDQERTTYFSLQ